MSDPAPQHEHLQDPSPDQLQQMARGGTRAVLMAQVASQLISVAVLAVLYRVLEPADFGLLGMAMPLVMLARMFASFGLNVAAVQRQQLSSGDLHSVFWLNMLLGWGAALLTAAAGPLLAWAYQTPALVSLCVALSFTLVLASAGATHQALLERRLAMRRVAGARVLAQAFGGAAGIGAALAGWQVWALVVQQYVEYATLAAVVWAGDPWRPRRLALSPGLHELLRFGGFYSASSLMFYIAMNADKVLLALLLGSTPAGQAMLGMYTQAFNLMMKPVYLVTTPITGIMLPALSRARRDHKTYARMVADFYHMVGIVLLPCGVGLFLVAQDAMAVLGGTEWLPAGKLLAALAPAIVVQGFISIAGSVLASAGRAGRLFFGALLVALLLTQGYAAGYWLGQQAGPAPWAPTLGVACSYSLVSLFVLFVPYMMYCFAVVGVPLREVFRPLHRAALAAAGMGLFVATLRRLLLGTELPVALRLMLLVVAGVATYAWWGRSELRWLREQLVHRRAAPPSTHRDKQYLSQR